MNNKKSKNTIKGITKKYLKPVIKFLQLIGFNPIVFLSLRHLPKYNRDRRKWLRRGGMITNYFPVLVDYNDSAGSASGHYFHQDLLVASFIASKNPKRHIDIGSRIDGFVAHVAAFRNIEVIDVRPLPATGHLNIIFVQADLMNQEKTFPTADSVSCLHAIEHFGLGRYTDPIDPNGHHKGFLNILRMIDVGGTLYISFPIGARNEVQFNAHRIFHPLDIFSWPGCENLKLERFDYVDDGGSLHQHIDINCHNFDVNFGCGIYSFTKIKSC